MKRRRRFLAGIAGLSTAVASVGGCRRPASTDSPGSRLLLAPIESAAPPFARALTVLPFRWPEDQGPHYAYRTEWWYYTGNLQSPDGAAFGYQLTIFRRGLRPGAPDPRGGLATNQIYLAHFALTDARRGTHVATERWSRGAIGLAGATAAPFRAYVEDWSAEAPDPMSAVQLRARGGRDAIDLIAEPRKPLVLHGDRGLSAKSSEPGNASYYVSSTRMAVRGRVTSGGFEASMVGEGWFDHEWSTSALGPRATGWDWFSLQLDDGRDIMVFRIRQDDGTVDPVSSATIVAASGSATQLAAADIDLAAVATWTSPETHTRYPSHWTLRLPKEDLLLDLRPIVADQEMRLSFQYWEGAVRLAGTARGRPVSGRGYVELTGYSAPLRRLF